MANSSPAQKQFFVGTRNLRYVAYCPNNPLSEALTVKSVKREEILSKSLESEQSKSFPISDTISFLVFPLDIDGT